MQEHFEQIQDSRTFSNAHLEMLHKDAYSEFMPELPSARNKNNLDFDSLEQHFKSAYTLLRNGDPYYWQEPASEGLANNQSNEQDSELPERDSSRLNREDDRQPYLDAARHQEFSADPNEQSPEFPESFSSRVNREDDRQPYSDRERHQDTELFIL